MERDLNYELEWRAVVHRNTEHHHVHMVIRGIDKNGKTVRIPPEYVKEGLRKRSAELATAELGHRLEGDIVQSQRRMITQSRFTDLDRDLLKRRDAEGLVHVDSTNLDLKALKLATEIHLERRLAHLEQIGLAEKVSEHTWHLKPDLEKSLRAVQQAYDRQRVMQQFGVMASDPRTPFQVTQWKNIDNLEGRVLVHGQEDQKNRAYMLFEDVNGKVHYLEHRNEIEDARRQGLLQPGSYVSMRVAFVDHKGFWIIEDQGPADQAIKDPEFIDRCLRRGANPPDHGLNGWLRQFRNTITRARYRPESTPAPGAPQQSERERVFHMPSVEAGAAPEVTTHFQPLPANAPKPRQKTWPIISLDQARAEFADALFEAGLIVPGGPIADGKLHRVAVEHSKKSNKSGAYVLHLDDFPAGYIMNYKIGVEITWRASGATRSISAEQIEEAKAKAAIRQAEQDAERRRDAQLVALRSEHRWKQAKPATEHPYLSRKAISGDGARIDQAGNLLVPMRDIDGRLWGVQSITADGEKKYPYGVHKTGTHALLGELDLTKPLIIAEGLATAATVRAMAGETVVAAFDSGNLLPVARAYREKYPELRIIFAADNDHHLPRQLAGTGKPKRNVGILKAEEAVAAIGNAIVVYPEFSPHDSGTDWNDFAVWNGSEATAKHFEKRIQQTIEKQRGQRKAGQRH